jgi:hypothetical protein
MYDLTKYKNSDARVVLEDSFLPNCVFLPIIAYIDRLDRVIAERCQWKYVYQPEACCKGIHLPIVANFFLRAVGLAASHMVANKREAWYIGLLGPGGMHSLQTHRQEKI